jgi:glutamate/aspartate transport system substrate-binding protein
MRTASGLLSLLILSVGMSAEAGEVLERIRTTGAIRIAHRESSVPFSYVAKDHDKPMGYTLELCTHIVEALEKTLKRPIAVNYIPVTPANRIAAITEGRADLECGSTTNNAERRKSVAFTVPHYITGARFMVRADSPIAELRDFEGKRLVSTKGTTALKAIIQANQERLLHIRIMEAPDHARAMAMVAAGEAEGFVMDDVLLYGLVASQPDPTKFKIVGKFLSIEALAIMLPKQDPEFKAIVDDEMKRLIGTREAHAIYAKWFETDLPDAGGSNLRLAMNYLLKETWRYPTDQVPDY